MSASHQPGGSPASSWDQSRRPDGQRRRAVDRLLYTATRTARVRRVRPYPSYRRTEEVVYFRFGQQYLGLRPADGGTHHYYDVGIEHLAFFVDTRQEVDDAYKRCLEMGANVHYPPELDRDITDYYARCVDPDGIRVEVASAPGV